MFPEKTVKKINTDIGIIMCLFSRQKIIHPNLRCSISKLFNKSVCLSIDNVHVNG